MLEMDSYDTPTFPRGRLFLVRLSGVDFLDAVVNRWPTSLGYTAFFLVVHQMHTELLSKCVCVCIKRWKNRQGHPE